MSFITDMFSKPKQKQTTTQNLTPQQLALQSILIRYMLQSMQTNQQNPGQFGLFRAGTMGALRPQLSILPREASAIPGIGAPPPGVNPILTNPALLAIGQGGGQ